MMHYTTDDNPCPYKYSVMIPAYTHADMMVPQC